MTIDIAGAPVSFGVFELTDRTTMASLPGPDRVCEVLAAAGYTGIDLGPLGYLGTGNELAARLRRFGLGLAGGWIDLPFSDDDRFTAALAQLDLTLETFVAGTAARSPQTAKPTLADAGDESRHANPGGGPELSLAGPRLQRFAANVQAAVDRVRSAGLEPTFHHHMGTFVETPDEIDVLLDLTDVGLTFDTGHLLLGGGSALEGWRRWRSRINHVHLKDVDLAVLRTVQARRGDMVDVWASRAFVPFGDGDLPIEEIVEMIRADKYSGWIVIEQDVLPSALLDAAAMERDQALNIERLAPLLDSHEAGQGEPRRVE